MINTPERPTIEERIQDAAVPGAPTRRNLGKTRQVNSGVRNLGIIAAVVVAAAIILSRLNLFGFMSHGDDTTATSAPPAAHILTAAQQPGPQNGPLLNGHRQIIGPNGQPVDARTALNGGNTTTPTQADNATVEQGLNAAGNAINTASGPNSTPIHYVSPQDVANIAASSLQGGNSNTGGQSAGANVGQGSSVSAAPGGEVVPAPNTQTAESVLVASAIPQNGPSLGIGNPNPPVNEGTAATGADSANIQVATPGALRSRARQEFMASASGARYLGSREEGPAAPVEIFASTPMYLKLDSPIDTSQCGYVWAEIMAPVRSSLPPYAIIFPASSTVRGRCSGDVAHGDARVTVAWDLITMPNGWTFDLKGMGASDAGGNGLGAQVNEHVGRTYTTVFLGTLLTAAAAMGNPGGQGLAPSAGNSIAGTAAGSLANAANGQLQQNLAIPPSLLVTSGKQFVIRVESTIINVHPYPMPRRLSLTPTPTTPATNPTPTPAPTK